MQFSTRELACWDVTADRWVVEGGEYALSVGASSRDLRLAGVLALTGDETRRPLTLESTLAEVLADPDLGPAVMSAMQDMAGDTAPDPGAIDTAPDPGAMGTDLLRIMGQVPLDRLVAFSGGRVTHEHLIALLQEWRHRKASGDEAGADEMLSELLLSINAIASGLRTTG